MNKTGRLIGVATAVASLVLAPAPSAYALFGFGDTVVVVEDIPGKLQWVKELAQWTEQIKKTTEIVRQSKAAVSQGKELLDKLGDPEELVEDIFKGHYDDIIPLRDLLDTEEVSAFLDAVAAVDALEYEFEHLDEAPVGKSFTVFGKRVRRSSNVYVEIAKEMALQDRLQAAVESRDEVLANEEKIQTEAVEELQSGRLTQSEIQLWQTRLAISRARAAAAEQKVDSIEKDLERFERRRSAERRLANVARAHEENKRRRELVRRAEKATVGWVGGLVEEEDEDE